MKAFVTGGSGQIGYHLVRSLIDRGYKVRCLIHNNVENYEGLDVELVTGDLLSIESMYTLLKDIDVVFHLAAKISLDEKEYNAMEKINLDGTKALAYAAKKAGVHKFIYFSSIHVLSHKPLDKPITEANKLLKEDKANGYALTKLKAHKFILDQIKLGFNAAIIIPTGVVGPGKNNGLMNQLIKKIAKRKISILFNTGYNWVDARDVASCAIGCAKKTKNNIQYIVSGHYITFKELIKLIRKVTKKKHFSFYLPLWIGYIVASIFPTYLLNKHSINILRYQNKRIDDSFAKKDLSYKTREFIITLEDILY